VVDEEPSAIVAGAVAGLVVDQTALTDHDAVAAGGAIEEDSAAALGGRAVAGDDAAKDSDGAARFAEHQGQSAAAAGVCLIRGEERPLNREIGRGRRSGKEPAAVA